MTAQQRHCSSDHRPRVDSGSDEWPGIFFVAATADMASNADTMRALNGQWPGEDKPFALPYQNDPQPMFRCEVANPKLNESVTERRRWPQRRSGLPQRLPVWRDL